MTRRIVPIILASLGVLAIIAGILAGTVFKESDTVAIDVPASSEPAVIAGPGVLPQVNDTVEVTASSDGDPIVLALAPMADIQAFVKGAAYRELQGLSDWDTMSIKTEEAAPAEGEEPVTLPNPASVDLFTEVRTAENTLTWTIDDPDHSLGFLATTDGTKPAPALTLKWSRDVATPLMWPLIIGGLVAMALAAVAVLWARNRVRRLRAPRPDNGETEVIYLPPLTSQETEGLTRREIRERERERERDALQAARREGRKNVSVVTSHEIPVIEEPLLEQNISRLTETAMAGGAMVIPFAPGADEIRESGTEENKYAPEGAAQISLDEDSEREEKAAATAGGLGALVVPAASGESEEEPAASALSSTDAEDLWPEADEELWPESDDRTWRDEWDFPANEGEDTRA